MGSKARFSRTFDPRWSRVLPSSWCALENHDAWLPGGFDERQCFFLCRFFCSLVGIVPKWGLISWGGKVALGGSPWISMTFQRWQLLHLSLPPPGRSMAWSHCKDWFVRIVPLCQFAWVISINVSGQTTAPQTMATKQPKWSPQMVVKCKGNLSKMTLIQV